MLFPVLVFECLWLSEYRHTLSDMLDVDVAGFLSENRWASRVVDDPNAGISGLMTLFRGVFLFRGGVDAVGCGVRNRVAW